MNMEAPKTIFDQLCIYYCFSEVERENAWQSLDRFRLGPNDPDVRGIILHHLYERDTARLAGTLEPYLSQARDLVDEASGTAKKVISDAARLTNKVVESGAMHLATKRDEAVAQTMSQVTDIIKATSQAVLREQAAKAQALASEEADRHGNIVTRTFILGAALGAVMLAAVAAGVSGYLVHHVDESHALSATTRLTATMTVQSTEYLTMLGEYNGGDIGETIRSQCADTKNRFNYQDKPACEVGLLLTPPSPPPPPSIR